MKMLLELMNLAMGLEDEPAEWVPASDMESDFAVCATPC